MMHERNKQRGSAVIEFPAVVVGLLVVILGLFAVYKIFYLQTRLDSAAYSMVSVASRALVSNGQAKNYHSDSAEHLMILARRSLPAELDMTRVGLILEMRFSASDETEVITQRAGNDCQVEQKIDSLATLAPMSKRTVASLQGKTANLYQVTLCVSQPLESMSPIFKWLGLPFPSSLRSQAAVIGRKYSA
ncbi:tight adherence pilus pseudopilin TadF [Vibrio hepatarius]|uniref:tight adherence pilus pseudopilin TadF n=1 Tax=Vibrio hepatarius TaxID=171383 RepID=UPI0020903798|nr:tight adherence pilus pseudopilin TadF [Vibrio hepatarius]